ncbi:MAG: hypothetical protein P8Y63_16295 [Deltaproteobacteria bacterium]
MARTSKKKQKKAPQEYETYCIQIADWEAPYSLSLESGRLGPGPYWEYASIRIKGIVIHPQKIAGKELDLTFLGRREIAAALSKASHTVRGTQQYGFLSLPFDAFPLITGLLAAGRYKYVILHGKALYYGSADIRSINFEPNFNEDEWV